MNIYQDTIIFFIFSKTTDFLNELWKKIEQKCQINQHFINEHINSSKFNPIQLNDSSCTYQFHSWSWRDDEEVVAVVVEVVLIATRRDDV